MKTISVTVSHGPPAAECHSSASKPLAITRTVGTNLYAITHIRSGMKIAQPTTRERARTALRAFLALPVDWSLDQAELLADGVRCAALVRPIKREAERA